MKDVYVLNDLDKILIDTGKFDLVIKTGDRDDIQVEYDEKLKADLDMGFENGTFKVASRKLDIFSLFSLNFGSQDKNTITVVVPNRKYKEFQVASLAGEVDVDGISADLFKINAKAGDFDIKNIKAATVTCSIGAGDLDFENVISNQFELDCKAGDVDVKDSVVGDVIVSVFAGDIDFQDVELGDVELKVNAGDLQFEDCKVNRCKGTILAGEVSFRNCAVDESDVNIKATAGDVSFR